ncbi:MAG: ribosome maturation factor RimM, partial [Streptosporangiaceae bacterium]
LQTQPTAAGPLTVVGTRWHSGRLLVRFDGHSDRTAAEQLSGTLLVIDSAEIPEPDDPDEFNDHQLIGMAVSTAAGERIGVLTDVRHFGQDLLVVAGEGPRAGTEILIPFVAAMVPEVNVAARTMTIDPPPGLLDLTQAGRP